jgi:hypothetical protein
MKTLALIALLFLLPTLAAAQERRSGEDFGGIAFKLAPPVAAFSNDYQLGWGISAMNEYVLTNRWSGSFDITYLRWGAKPENESVKVLTMIAFTLSLIHI